MMVKPTAIVLFFVLGSATAFAPATGSRSQRCASSPGLVSGTDVVPFGGSVVILARTRSHCHPPTNVDCSYLFQSTAACGDRVGINALHPPKRRFKEPKLTIPPSYPVRVKKDWNKPLMTIVGFLLLSLVTSFVASTTTSSSAELSLTTTASTDQIVQYVMEAMPSSSLSHQIPSPTTTVLGSAQQVAHD